MIDGVAYDPVVYDSSVFFPGAYLQTMFSKADYVQLYTAPASPGRSDRAWPTGCRGIVRPALGLVSVRILVDRRADERHDPGAAPPRGRLPQRAGVDGE